MPMEGAPATEGLSYRDDWEIPREDLTLLREIGSGQFGCVFEGKWNGTHQVAVKQLKNGMMDSRDFLREARIMKECRHPRLIQLYAVGKGAQLLKSLSFFCSRKAREGCRDLWEFT
jgi:serine/threonine protein kinase